LARHSESVVHCPLNDGAAAVIVLSDAKASELGLGPLARIVSGATSGLSPEITLGHPFGMTGARILTTLINALELHDRRIGLVTMCVGGGQGMALIIERLS
jgi:acetyl-CoA C-acetyltransferase